MKNIKQSKKGTAEIFYINILILILFITMFIGSYILVNMKITNTEVEIRNTISELDTNIKSGVDSVLYLKTAVDVIYENQKKIGLNYVKKIHSIDDKGNYALDVENIANLTGYDGLKTDKKTQLEMEMSVALTPCLKIVKKLNKNYAWIYYISKQKFSTMYPFVKSKDFIWYAGNAEEPLWQEALPKNNPKGKFFFTPLYFDGVGLGLMVTLGHPIYVDDEFRGTIDLDITLASQSKFLDKNNLFNGTYFVSNKQDQIIAASGLKDFNSKKIFSAQDLIAEDILSLDTTNDKMILSNGRYVYVHNLKNAPWKMYYYIDNMKIYQRTLYYNLAILVFIIILFKVRSLLTQLKLTQVKLEESKVEIEKTHKNTRDSIEYASLIQGALLSTHNDIQPFFKDSFTYWMPKDTVGGDIWLFNELRHKDECLLMFIDCTGHGVPGAFVTMIVKAIEREIIANLKKHLEFDISPAIIMSHFNKTMKVLLKQTNKDSLSNAGWDGGIIYYNRRTQILKFAGAETSLFYIDENQEFKTVKGNRYSVGYKKCDMDYIYKETIINVKEGMKFYCTTDGFLDQNGGGKDFPFGKKRFGNIIKENHIKSMYNQKEIFINTMKEYEAIMEENHDRNDDMTLIAFEIGEKSDFKEDSIKEILKYEGVITQNFVATAIDNIETKIQNKTMLVTVSTIAIEYCQNMMNYSKNDIVGSIDIVPAGKIEIQNINNEYYTIKAINITSKEDKEKIEAKLIEIQSLDKAGIRKRYRELRRSGENTHEKGAGFGMYEIAKMSDSIEYKFKAINEDKYTFMMKSVVKPKVKRGKDEEV